MPSARFIVTIALAMLLAACERRSNPRAGTGWAASTKPIRVVAYNVQWNQAGVERVVSAIRDVRPDVILLSEVPPAHLGRMAKLLGETHGSTFHVFGTPNNPGEWSLPSTAILSRFPITNAHPIPNGAGRDFGVLAELRTESGRFCVAAVHLTATRRPTPAEFGRTEKERGRELAALLGEWESLAKPPLIVGGDFNQLSFGSNYDLMTRNFLDSLGRLKKGDWTCKHGLLQTRVDYLLLSREWKPVAGGVIANDASDHRPVWVEVRAK